jgi:beta-glucosidase/6-phospho-beta-glucosidase/beta-galactosidase
MESRLFKSFFMGGFECSTHRLRSGQRLDIIASTQHDRFVREDFIRLRQLGMRTLRSGIRWHLIETRPGYYDFSSVLPALRAARDLGMEVIWDLCHYGWPDSLDIFSSEFIDRFNGVVKAFAEIWREESEGTPFFCPVNEISFLSWAGGEVAYLNPFEQGRGFELKLQLVRASIAAMDTIREVLPDARFVHVEPVINVLPHPSRPEDTARAEAKHHSQYEAWDLLSGRLHPEIGGRPEYLDILGLNYYPHNQWFIENETIWLGEPHYRPFRELVWDVYKRYGRPMFISETGVEDDERVNWLRYVAEETAALIEMGVPLMGLCWYPILCHPGWDDERHCYNGLWDYCDENGRREIYQPLADEIHRQQEMINQAQQAGICN